MAFLWRFMTNSVTLTRDRLVVKLSEIVMTCRKNCRDVFLFVLSPSQRPVLTLADFWWGEFCLEQHRSLLLALRLVHLEVRSLKDPIVLVHVPHQVSLCLSNWQLTSVGPAPLQTCVGDFCCINFEGFCRRFPWRTFWALFFPQEWVWECKNTFYPPMATKTKTMVLVFGFSVPCSAGFQGKNGFYFWFQFFCLREGVGVFFLWIGAEIWEGDERRKFQFLESGDSLNGRNLFTEEFLTKSLHSPNALPPFSEKALFFTDFCFVTSPSQNSVPINEWGESIFAWPPLQILAVKNKCTILAEIITK